MKVDSPIDSLLALISSATVCPNENFEKRPEMIGSKPKYVQMPKGPK